MQNYEYKNSQLLNLLEPEEIVDLLGEDGAEENQQQLKDANLALMSKLDQQEDDNIAQIMTEEASNTQSSKKDFEMLRQFHQSRI